MGVSMGWKRKAKVFKSETSFITWIDEHQKIDLLEVHFSTCFNNKSGKVEERYILIYEERSE